MMFSKSQHSQVCGKSGHKTAVCDSLRFGFIICPVQHYGPSIEHPAKFASRLFVARQVPLVGSLVLEDDERDILKARIADKLQNQDMALVAHYYVDGDLQDLAEQTGGCVSDSLEMARFGRDHAARELVVAGVRFMGETAKILSPKNALYVTFEAECSSTWLSTGCSPSSPPSTRIEQVVMPTPARVKALADWVVTSAAR